MGKSVASSLALGLGLNLVIVLLPFALRGGMGSLLTERAVLLFLVGASGLCAADLAGTIDAGPERLEHDRRTALSAYATGLGLLLVFWAALGGRAVGGPAPFREVGGLACMLGGALLRYGAARVLRGFFVTAVRVAPGQPLLQGGVYGWLRHPSETGLLLAAGGGFVLMGSVAAFVLWGIVLVPLVLWRVSREDAVLEKAFGLDQRRYARAVGSLVPHFGRRGRRSLTGL